VVVVAAAHPRGRDLVRDGVELRRELLPVVGRLAELLVDPGADQVLVPDRLVVLDRLREGVALEGVDGGVGAAALQSVVVEELAHLGRAAVVVPGELDRLVPEALDGLQRPGQVLLAVVADRVELDSELVRRAAGVHVPPARHDLDVAWP
jgi:hypothetical protein